MKVNRKFSTIVGNINLLDAKQRVYELDWLKDIISKGFAQIGGTLVVSAYKNRLSSLSREMYEDQARFESALNRIYIDVGDARDSALTGMGYALCMLDSPFGGLTGAGVISQISIDDTEASVTFFADSMSKFPSLYEDVETFDQPMAILIVNND